MGLHVKDLSVKLPKKTILKGISFLVEKGETIGLIGKNASGKSTLLKAIFGIISYQRGSISVDDRTFRNFKERKTVIKYLPQHTILPNHVKINELFNMFCPEGANEEMGFMNMMEKFGEKRCRELSGGERRLMELLMFLCSNAKILLLDEPFSGLSPILKETALSLIQDLSCHKCIIISDHDLSSLVEISDKILLLREGNIYLQRKDIEQIMAEMRNS